MSAKTKILVAKTIAAILGVLILIVVGLMIYLSIAKLRSEAGEESPTQSAEQTTLTLVRETAAPLIAQDCNLGELHVSDTRIVIEVTGANPDCQQLIILKTSNGALVSIIPLR